MNLQLSDIYRIFRDAVRYSPPTVPIRPCLQLQAFRVLQRDPRQNSELGTDTLGVIPTDKDSPFFYSRPWELAKFPANAVSYKYPILTAFEIANDGENVLSPGGTITRTYTLELSVLDSFQGDKGKNAPQSCDGRSINQIYFDTEVLLDSVLRYLGGIVTATTDVDPVEKVYNVAILEALKTANTINSYSVKTYPGTVLAGDNKSLRFVRVEYPARNIYGTRVQLKVKVSNCPTINFASDVLSLGTIGFEAGCQNC
jgi:hypothetical protein